MHNNDLKLLVDEWKMLWVIPHEQIYLYCKPVMHVKVIWCSLVLVFSVLLLSTEIHKIILRLISNLVRSIIPLLCIYYTIANLVDCN